jgi:hypothetical protein
MYRKRLRSTAPSTVAAKSHWGTFCQSAVVPLATTLISKRASGAILLQAHHCEHFLRVLSTMKVQDVLAGEQSGENSAPSAHPGGSGSLAPAGNYLVAEFRKGGQLELSRWPWGMLGKEVREQDIASHSSEVRLPSVIEKF